MKKILAVVLCVMLFIPVFPIVFAVNARDVGFETSLASQLKELGLLRGIVDNGNAAADFALNRQPSRLEALIMLIRTLGKEADVKTYPNTHPFTDVPAWADGYVSYAYNNGLTKGISDTLLGTDDTASADMYLTFMLRALGYSDEDGGAYTWDTPEALAAWCGILPLGVDETNFLRADMVDVTCAALYADIKGTQTTLHDHLVLEGVFTAEQFDMAFPENPFAEFQRLESRISEVIAGNLSLGTMEDNVYAVTCHVIADVSDSGDVLTVSTLVCYGKYTLHKNGYLNASSTVAPWLIELDANTLELKSCRMAYQFREEGFALTDCFSEKTLSALTALRMPMRDVCQMQIKMLMDSGTFVYRQPTYEESLAKAAASLSEVIETLEAGPCTALLGKADGQEYYELFLIFKPGSAIGEGESQTIKSSSVGELWLGEDGLTLHYSYHYENLAFYEGLPPMSYSSLPNNGTIHYIIDLITGETAFGFQSD